MVTSLPCFDLKGEVALVRADPISQGLDIRICAALNRGADITARVATGATAAAPH